MKTFEVNDVPQGDAIWEAVKAQLSDNFELFCFTVKNSGLVDIKAVQGLTDESDPDS